MNKLSQTVPIQYDTPFSPYAASNWRAAFADVADKGLSGVEIAVAYPAQVDVDDLLYEAERNALTITTISTGQIYALDGVWLTAPESDKRKRAQNIVREHIDLSQKLGCPPVTLGLIRGKLEQGDKNELLALLRETVSPLCEYAAEHGVALQLEAINKNETSILNSTADCLEFIDALGNPPSLTFLYDTYHSYLEETDMPSAIRMAGARITNVHLADSHRGLPGEGKIDFAAVSMALAEIGYMGPISLETLSIPSREHIMENYASCIKRFFTDH